MLVSYTHAAEFDLRGRLCDRFVYEDEGSPVERIQLRPCDGPYKLQRSMTEARYDAVIGTILDQ